MECSDFNKNRGCSRGALCPFKHEVKPEHFSEIIFNQNEMILALLSKQSTQLSNLQSNCELLKDRIDDLEDAVTKISKSKKKKGKDSEDIEKEDENSMYELMKKINLCLDNQNAMKDSLANFGVPTLPPLTHLLNSGEGISSHPERAFSLKGPNTTSMGLEYQKHKSAERKSAAPDDDATIKGSKQPSPLREFFTATLSKKSNSHTKTRLSSPRSGEENESSSTESDLSSGTREFKIPIPMQDVNINLHEDEEGCEKDLLSSTPSDQPVVLATCGRCMLQNCLCNDSS